ncbi:MAG: hypothetical protein H6Q89_1864 [Myxococcaceae bacterium]|nr:hypothetical protein [Myxococcaceae bacterium]
MTDFKSRIGSDWKKQLNGVLERARAAGEKGLLVFDLDSTVFDNRPRQSRILREYGAARGLKVLEGCQPSHWNSGWDLKAAMLSCGLSAELADQHYSDAKSYWGARFFTSEYCVDDIEVPGAPQYLQAAHDTGAQVVYVTGRHEEMRVGSVKCMEKCRMPLPGNRVCLVMKPTLRESDDAYKVQAHAQLAKMGTVIAAFDNEPTHANDYAKKFVDATVIHLATDHSGRPVELLSRIISVPDLRL